MAVTVKKLQEIRDSLKQTIEGELGVVVSTFGKNFLNTLIGALSGRYWLFYLSIGRVQKNIFPDLADSETQGGTLERFGRVKLNRNPFPATDGIYEIQVTGQIGATIPQNQTFKSDDNSSNPGKLYILDTPFTFTAPTETILVRSLSTGPDAQLAIGDTLTSTGPIVNVDRGAEVLTEDTAPLAAEDLEVYREKILEAFRLEAQGGASADYRIWAADAQGVRRVYPYAKSGASAEINLFVEATTVDSVDGKGTPTAAILQEVEDVIELDPDTTLPIEERGRRPLGVFRIYYLPITVRSVEITIDGFVGITATIQTRVNDAIVNYLSTVRPFIAGADILENRNDVLSVSRLSFIVFDTLPPGVYFDSISLVVDGNSVTQFVFLNGDIPYLDSLTINT